MNNSTERNVLQEQEVQNICQKMAEEIFDKYGKDEPLAVVGIYTRGAYLARRIHEYLEEMTLTRIPLGYLDINLYRDDLTTLREQPVIRSTDLPFAVAGQRIVLVDDVIFTGRTVRAALEALLDFGRPAAVFLAVMVDRGWREYPIQPDVIGMTLQTTLKESVELKLREVDDRDVLLIKKIPGNRYEDENREGGSRK